jgi:SAM-dependent methyltransferase
LEKFYPQEYWGTEEAVQESKWAGMFSGMENSYREFVVADHVRFLDSCARKRPSGNKYLLDIGCGSGTFLHVARSHGFAAFGMDRSGQAVQTARRHYGLDVRRGEIGAMVWEDMRFDFITMFHVLEHLPDPREALLYAAKLLRTAGTLIIQVPNVSSIQARVFGKRWYGLDVPRHVINYTPKAISFLLRETGFKFRLLSRFSLRDNPASLASSLVPSLDPIGRKGRGLYGRPVFNGIMEIAYFGLYVASLPAAFVESSCGFGATVWACAWRKE